MALAKVGWTKKKNMVAFARVFEKACTLHRFDIIVYHLEFDKHNLLSLPQPLPQHAFLLIYSFAFTLLFRHEHTHKEPPAGKGIFLNKTHFTFTRLSISTRLK